MKKNVIKALGWGIAVIIAMILVDFAGGNEISFIRAMLAGLIMGVVDFIFSTITDRVRAKKKN